MPLLGNEALDNRGRQLPDPPRRRIARLEGQGVARDRQRVHVRRQQHRRDADMGINPHQLENARRAVEHFQPSGGRTYSGKTARK
jgi:hypothetical protein